MRPPSKPPNPAPPRNRRLAAELYADEGYATLITVRADRGTPFADHPALCRSTLDLLREMRLDYGCWLGAYCLMPDHLHFVAGPATAESSVLVYTERFKGKSTNQSWTCGWSGRLWQKRFHDHVLRGRVVERRLRLRAAEPGPRGAGGSGGGVALVRHRGPLRVVTPTRTALAQPKVPDQRLPVSPSSSGT